MTNQCSLCEPGACHDDACPHGLPRKVADAEPHLDRYGIDWAAVNKSSFKRYLVEAWSQKQSNDDVRHVPFGEGER